MLRTVPYSMYELCTCCKYIKDKNVNLTFIKFWKYLWQDLIPSLIMKSFQNLVKLWTSSIKVGNFFLLPAGELNYNFRTGFSFVNYSMDALNNFIFI